MSFSDMVKLGTQASGGSGAPGYPSGMMTAQHPHPGDYTNVPFLLSQLESCLIATPT